MLISFLNRGRGRLSGRARSTELSAPTDKEVERIEQAYARNFNAV